MAPPDDDSTFKLVYSAASDHWTHAEQVSLQNFGGNVGGSFAPLVTGMLVSSSGDFTVPLLVAAGVALVFGCGSYGLIVGDLDRELDHME